MASWPATSSMSWSRSTATFCAEAGSYNSSSGRQSTTGSPSLDCRRGTLRLSGAVGGLRDLDPGDGPDARRLAWPARSVGGARAPWLTPDVDKGAELSSGGQTLVGERFEEIGEPAGLHDGVRGERGRGDEDHGEVGQLQERVGFGRRDQVHAEETRADGTDEPDDRHHREADDHVGLAAQRVAVQVLAHVLDLLPHLGEETIGVQRIVSHAVERLRVWLAGDFVEPVAVREAQEGLLQLPDRALESLDRLGVLDVQLVERVDQPVRQHDERRPVEVSDQEQQEVLVTEVSQQSRLAVDEVAVSGAADRHERLAGAQVPGAGAVVPEAVVTASGLEVDHV